MVLPLSNAIANYQVHLQDRLTQEAARRLHRAQRGWQQAQTAAQILREDYGVQQVWLFGSLLSPERVDDLSDLDLAVSGLSLSRYCEAVGDLLVKIQGFNVDLVRLETAQSSLKAQILSKGVLL